MIVLGYLQAEVFHMIDGCNSTGGDAEVQDRRDLRPDLDPLVYGRASDGEMSTRLAL